MTLFTPRFLLFLIWFAGYAICFAVVCAFVPLGFTVVEALPANLTQLTGLFAPYIGPVVCFWFAKDVVGKAEIHDRHTFVIAVLCSAFFNAVILSILLSIFFRSDGEAKIEQSLALMSQVATLLAFLVGPAIGFFFGRSGGGASSERGTRPAANAL